MFTGSTEVRNVLLEVPDIRDEDVTVAEDEADANWCTYFYLYIYMYR